MYNRTFRLTADWSVEEDVMSGTFVAAWRTRERTDADGGSLRPWLLGVATNVAPATTRAAAGVTAPRPDGIKQMPTPAS
ncbi:RNA polymerase sigma factor [Streptomyces sp. NPDC060366]|uniref:RNA polymerase sigma factor n=1 Tax=Streptomyces sp. NPDC060366 TaxID=3347105 RepID=UPI00365A799A